MLKLSVFVLFASLLCCSALADPIVLRAHKHLTRSSPEYRTLELSMYSFYDIAVEGFDEEEEVEVVLQDHLGNQISEATYSNGIVEFGISRLHPGEQLVLRATGKKSGKTATVTDVQLKVGSEWYQQRMKEWRQNDLNKEGQVPK